MAVPVTRYAKSGDVHIAYQVFGNGATDLVIVPGFISHIENSLGDGVLATFDGPARAVRCAFAIVEAVRQLEIQIRCGLHTGEIEMAGRDVEGIAVHIASRVSALAEAGETLVSRTVKDLVAGSGLHFDGRGRHSLKGLLEPMELYAASR
jgi:class 3 adenylate cyclase